LCDLLLKQTTRSELLCADASLTDYDKIVKVFECVSGLSVSGRGVCQFRHSSSVNQLPDGAPSPCNSLARYLQDAVTAEHNETQTDGSVTAGI